jgi:hypothetical protein
VADPQVQVIPRTPSPENISTSPPSTNVYWPHTHVSSRPAWVDDVAAAGLLIDIDTIDLDRGYDSPAVRTRLAGCGPTDAVIHRRGTTVAGRPEIAGAARAAVDRRGDLVIELRAALPQHRPARPSPTPALCLASVVLNIGKLIAWRNRWSPT